MKNRPHYSTPVSKVNTKKWSNFLAHIRGEAEFMKSVRENATDERKSSNSMYSTLYQKTSKTIFSTGRKSQQQYVPPPDSVPRIPKKKALPKLPEKTNQIILNANPENLYNWPKRESPATRILKPERINDFPDIHRKKDVNVVSGALYSGDYLLEI